MLLNNVSNGADKYNDKSLSYSHMSTYVLKNWCRKMFIKNHIVTNAHS